MSFKKVDVKLLLASVSFGVIWILSMILGDILMVCLSVSLMSICKEIGSVGHVFRIKGFENDDDNLALLGSKPKRDKFAFLEF
jgi:hypothetical protein